VAQAEIPLRKSKQARPHYDEVVAVIAKRGQYLIGQRPKGGLLGGLWEFPGMRLEAGETHEQGLQRLQELMGIEVEVGGQIAIVEHAYSHFSVTLHVYACRYQSGKAASSGHDELRWVRSTELAQYAFPGTNRKFLRLLC